MIFSLSQVLLVSIFHSVSLSISSLALKEICAVYREGKILVHPVNNNCFDRPYFEEKSYFIPLSPQNELKKLIINENEWNKVEIFQEGERYLLTLTEHPNRKETKIKIKLLRKKCTPLLSLNSLYSLDYSSSSKCKEELTAGAHDNGDLFGGAMIYVRKRRNLEPLFRDLFGVQGKVSVPEVNVGFLKTDGKNGFEASFKTIKFQRMIVWGNYYEYFLRIPYNLNEDLSSNVGILIQENYFFGLYMALDENKGNESFLSISLKSSEPLGYKMDISWFGIKNRTFSWFVNDGSIILPEPSKDESNQAYFNVVFKFISPEQPVDPILLSRAKALLVKRN